MELLIHRPLPKALNCKLFSTTYKENMGSSSSKTTTDNNSKKEGLQTIYLAGGCFWGMEEILRNIPGVNETEAGYTGGWLENPKYEDTHHGASGHAESVKVVFDPKVLPLQVLLEDWFFKMHDPTTEDRQGNDTGSEYRSAIFTLNDDQKQLAQEVKKKVDDSGKWRNGIVTEITTASAWYSAEKHHQKYLVKNPGGYTCHWMRK